MRETEYGKKKVGVCRKFGLLNSTIQNICKNRNKIIGAFEQNGLRIERFRKSERSDVNEALLKWFEQQSSSDMYCTSERSISHNSCSS
jgi:hypothetical protein